MLKKVDLTQGAIAQKAIKDAPFPAPFDPTLEYSAAVRGTWNIVNTGMLIPEAHEIFVCAQGCLRGVVLTAAEMGKMERFSSIFVQENNVLNGDMESLIIDGVSDILSKLKYTPRAVLLYTSCIHHFIACDLNYVYKTLREKFPHIDFIDCYMTPTMRKSGLNPEELMCRQLYSLWHKKDLDPKRVNIIGNNLATDKESDLIKLLSTNDLKVTEIHDCHTYEDYQEMAKGAVNIFYNSVAWPAVKYLKETYGQDYLYLPTSYNYDEMNATLTKLAQYFDITLPDYSHYQELIEAKLMQAKEIIQDAPIAIDYTVSMRILSLARLLLDHGFNVCRIYADGFEAVEKDDFYYLKEHYPQLQIFSVNNFKMRFNHYSTGTKVLAIGQKAAYFTDTPYFVNTINNGGFYGFNGILKMLDLIIEAFLKEKDTAKLVQKKAWGCELI